MERRLLILFWTLFTFNTGLVLTPLPQLAATKLNLKEAAAKKGSRAEKLPRDPKEPQSLDMSSGVAVFTWSGIRGGHTGGRGDVLVTHIRTRSVYITATWTLSGLTHQRELCRMDSPITEGKDHLRKRGSTHRRCHGAPVTMSATNIVQLSAVEGSHKGSSKTGYYSDRTMFIERPHGVMPTAQGLKMSFWIN
ncbi:Hypothetical predicted protein [Pelobates cultripes]|uniref:Uncharacterized protein n=1 Tax=Pelobates cultripes TaxID=61616 RepID=A0AAD1SQJ6_PELCU|nr:Hypothetical predicted protein [Pelobates cultripes]